MIDNDCSGWVHISELISFIRSIGYEMPNDMGAILQKRFGERVDFLTFLSLFDFSNDAMIKYKYTKKKGMYKLYLTPDRLEHLANVKDLIKKQNRIEMDLDKIRLNHGIKTASKSR